MLDVLVFILAWLGTVALNTTAVYFLWNTAMTSTFHLPVVDIWQAFILLLLGSVLSGNGFSVGFDQRG